MIEISRPFIILIILLSVIFLAVPGIRMSIGQRQDTSAFGQLTLAQQAPALSQQQVLNNTNNNNTNSVPVLNASKLQVELVTDGLDFPTSMSFIGNYGDLLISEKGGRVILFSNENNTKIPLGNFSVNQQSERGLLGVAVLANNNISNASTTTAAIAMTNNSERISTSDNGIRDANATSASTPTYVYFYLTDATTGNASQILGNRIFRFEWDDTNKSLSNRTLILELPATPGPNHNGGKLIADSENGHIYAVIGDLNRNGMLQNFKNGSLPDDTSVILRMNPDGSPAQDNPFLDVSRTNSSISSSYANLSKYFAYGIRNSFGLAIDPVTGILWDTENGPIRSDEINIVRPGFNSGWEKVMGPAERRNVTAESDLVNFEGSASSSSSSSSSSSYSDPVFSWGRAVGVTDIEFYDSDKLGTNYTNNIFVGDFNNGHLYYFEVNENRSGLQFENPRIADDLVASNQRQVASVIFGTGFTGGITDIETGPDGYLYVLTYPGKLYRIVVQE